MLDRLIIKALQEWKSGTVRKLSNEIGESPTPQVLNVV
jgi:hypothetical protein